MLKKIFYIVFLYSFLINCQCFADDIDKLVFKYDIHNFNSLVPRNFRVMGPTSHLPSINENISASGQFTENQLLFLKDLAQKQNQKLIVLDLRDEVHLFINGLPVRVMTKKFEDKISTKDFSYLLGKTISIYVKDKKNHVKVKVNSVLTEEELLKKHNVKYINIKNRDHFAPSSSLLTQFHNVITNIPENYWVHIHCKAGRGRTTTYLMIYTIYNYHDKVSLNDMIKYHKHIGGIDLSFDQAYKKAYIFKDMALDRALFIHDLFYNVISRNKKY